MNDELGDRMKEYERVGETRLDPTVPTVARVDGRSFHSFCAGLPRPFDKRVSDLMIAMTMHVAAESGALFAYTQSDEATFVYLPQPGGQLYFGGRVGKMVSALAAQASVYFNRFLPTAVPERARMMPTFDARVWNVPNRTEGANTVLWRTLDCEKNSVAMHARAHFSHRELQDKGRADMLSMLTDAGHPWDEQPDFFKRGTMIRRVVVSRPFTADEMDRLPPMHEARRNPGLIVARQTLIATPLDRPFVSVQNREDVVFAGAEPA